MSDVLNLSHPVRLFVVVMKGDINAWIHNKYMFNDPSCDIFNILLNVMCWRSLMYHMIDLHTISRGIWLFYDQMTFRLLLI